MQSRNKNDDDIDGAGIRVVRTKVFQLSLDFEEVGSRRHTEYDAGATEASKSTPTPATWPRADCGVRLG